MLPRGRAYDNTWNKDRNDVGAVRLQRMKIGYLMEEET